MDMESSSYSPLLINPIQSSSPSSPSPLYTFTTTTTASNQIPSSPSFQPRPVSTHLTPPPPRRVRLIYPYPLILLSLLDLIYTLYRRSSDISDDGKSVEAAYPVPTFFLVLSGIRAAVVGLVVGSSKRWRNRGGWIAGCSVLTLCVAVWTFCADLLGEEEDRSGDSQMREGSVGVGFLVVVSVMLLLLISISPVELVCPVTAGARGLRRYVNSD